MLHKLFVQGVRDLMPADEREYKDVLTAVRDLGQLALKIADVGFEAIILPHLEGENMMVVPLSLPARCILGEECFRHHLEVVERM